MPTRAATISLVVAAAAAAFLLVAWRIWHREEPVAVSFARYEMSNWIGAAKAGTFFNPWGR